MCDICGKNPCDARCPNAEDKGIYTCVECGQYIYEELCDEKFKEAKEEIEWMN